MTEKIEASYDENFGEDPPLAESLVDSKLLKANAQKKKEEKLIEQVEKLEQKLEEVTKITEIEDDSEVKDELETTVEDNIENSTANTSEDNPPPNYDVELNVKPYKLPMIKTEVIDGQRCIVVPMNDDEQVTINGMKDLF